MRKKWLLLFTMIFTLFIPTLSFADAAEGDVINTLGQDLTEEQKNKILNEIDAPGNAQQITVSNEEEHKYLGDVIPKSQIGSRAISSSAITIEAEGSGLEVKTNSINWVTDDMYLNALMTAGVKDATIYITSPFPVSGTAALTGLMKAYEISSDKAIPDDIKKIANEEMVKTAQLGDEVGAENAAALIANIKEKIAKNTPETTEEVRALIEQAAADLGMTLTDEQLNSLIDLFNKMKELNIDWNQVGDQLNKAKEKLTNFLESEEGQNFLEKLKEVFASFIDVIKSLFS